MKMFSVDKIITVICSFLYLMSHFAPQHRSRENMGKESSRRLLKVLLDFLSALVKCFLTVVYVNTCC